jgi:hypothetical protein
MKSLTIEQEELLLDLLFNHDGVEVFLKELEGQVISVEQDLVKLFLLDKVEDDRRLLRLKFESQGARKLFIKFQTRLEQIKLATLKAETP